MVSCEAEPCAAGELMFRTPLNTGCNFSRNFKMKIQDMRKISKSANYCPTYPNSINVQDFWRIFAKILFKSWDFNNYAFYEYIRVELEKSEMLNNETLIVKIGVDAADILIVCGSQACLTA